MKRPILLLFVLLTFQLSVAFARKSVEQHVNEIAHDEARTEISRNELVPPSRRKSEKKESFSKNEDTDEGLKAILLDLRKQLKSKGLKIKLLEKVLRTGGQTDPRVMERLIKKTKKRISMMMMNVRGKKKRTRGFKGANLGLRSNIRRSRFLNANQRMRVRGSLNPCPKGQTRRRGRCRCPYLSTWNAETRTCDCIYGTYKDRRGNCRSYI